MRIVRVIAWGMFGLAVVLLVGGVTLAFSYADVYGWPSSFGEAVSQGWWLVAIVAWFVAVGWLLLRIARKTTQGRTG